MSIISFWTLFTINKNKKRVGSISNYYNRYRYYVFYMPKNFQTRSGKINTEIKYDETYTYNNIKNKINIISTDIIYYIVLELKK